MSLEVGSRVHYSGDMANSSGWFTVRAIRPTPSRITYDLAEIDGDRTFRAVAVDPAAPYAGHCAPRFVTGEAYDAYMESRARI